MKIVIRLMLLGVVICMSNSMRGMTGFEYEGNGFYGEAFQKMVSRFNCNPQIKINEIINALPHSMSYEKALQEIDNIEVDEKKKVQGKFLAAIKCDLSNEMQSWIDKGASCDHDGYHLTPLYEANNSPKCTKILLGLTKDKKAKRDALGIAIGQACHFEVVKLYFEEDLGFYEEELTQLLLKIPSFSGSCYTIHEIKKDHKKVFSLLCTQGADPKAAFEIFEKQWSSKIAWEKLKFIASKNLEEYKSMM